MTRYGSDEGADKRTFCKAPQLRLGGSVNNQQGVIMCVQGLNRDRYVATCLKGAIKQGKRPLIKIYHKFVEERQQMEEGNFCKIICSAKHQCNEWL